PARRRTKLPGPCQARRGPEAIFDGDPAIFSASAVQEGAEHTPIAGSGQGGEGNHPTGCPPARSVPAERARAHLLWVGRTAVLPGGRVPELRSRASRVGRVGRWIFGGALLLTLVGVVAHFSDERQFADLLQRAEPAWLVVALGLQALTY